MHFLFPRSTAVPAGLHNSLFLPRNSMHPVPSLLSTSRTLPETPSPSEEAATAESNELLGSQLPRYCGEEQESPKKWQILNRTRVEIFKKQTLESGTRKIWRERGRSNDLLQRNDGLSCSHPSHVTYPAVMGERPSTSALNLKKIQNWQWLNSGAHIKKLFYGHQ